MRGSVAGLKQGVAQETRDIQESRPDRWLLNKNILFRLKGSSNSKGAVGPAEQSKREKNGQGQPTWACRTLPSLN